ncbi:DNA helicase, DnaB-like, C-terminal [uncultured Caudovirales phage]|uniref:DNA helicase, DnaB-like, C-terminal n=1 Tax=uncultured Caudovirales phage TaxID=2100421 RepID=A0A6J7WJS0_9CAUD|nr:DNA helicase, DnaB-like, C-terminal [uncultured Caudovirales phage]
MLITEDIDFDAYREAENIRNRVREKSEFTDEINHYFATRLHGIDGDKLPWHKCDQLIGFRKAEVSIWAGENGSGKSLMLGQLKLGLLAQDKKVLTASLEMQPYKTLARMARQATGVTIPSKSQIEAFSAWKMDRGYLYDHVGRLEPWQAVALCRYAAKELGIQHLIIDSMMKCVRGEDDYNGQKDFVDALCDVAKETQLHIHLVHHLRKSGEGDKIAEKKDIKGSGIITDLVDNVFLVARNRKKEKETEVNMLPDNSKPDTFLVCAKQRNGEWEGTLGFWYEKKSLQFTEEFGLPMMRFLEQ